MVVKLPGQTGLANAVFAQAVAATPALPDGVVNVLTETGNEVASLLVDSPDVGIVSYTGSTAVGQVITRNAAPTLKRMNLELGGKNPLVVLDDADLDVVVPQLRTALLIMNGQYCCTGSRVLVHASLADELRKRLTETLRDVRVGPADDPATELGPVIDAASVDRLDKAVESARNARILLRGGKVHDESLPPGAYFRPALIELDDLNSPLIQEELFGPVQTFEVFADDADAIRRANANRYGLAASVFGHDVSRAREVAREIDTGAVWINCWGIESSDFEEGGVKASGVGYLSGPMAIEQFQQLKVYTELTPRGAAAARARGL